MSHSHRHGSCSRLFPFVSRDSIGKNREDLLLQKYSDLVKASVVVPDSEVMREYSARTDKATIRFGGPRPFNR